jgi:MFS family permease
MYASRQVSKSTTTGAYPSAARRNYTLAVLLAAYILSFIDRQILNLLVDPIRRTLRVTDFQMSLIQGMAFALFYVSLGLPIGRLADRHNRKVIVGLGVFVWSAMTAACGLATSFMSLFLARIGVGIGEAALSPASYSILADSFPPARLARAAYVFTCGITIGGGLAYLIGGKIIDWAATTQGLWLPMLGSVKPWQLTFLVVGLPGILVGALVLATLKEPRRRGGTCELEPAPVQLTDVYRFIRQRWRCYASIFGSVSLLAVVGYGYLNWYPTFLIRTYGLKIGDVGRSFGLIYLIFGTAGSVGGVLLSESLGRRGYKDANLRVVALMSAALWLPAACGPLMPSARLALVVAAPTTFLLNGYFGASIAALQIITPNRMRAVTSASFLLCTTLTGMGLGTSLVAACTDFVFRDDMSLRYSLAILAVVVCPLASIVGFVGLKDYRLGIIEDTSPPGA